MRHVFASVEQLAGAGRDILHRNIMDMVGMYWESKMLKPPFRPGVDPVPSSGKVIDEKDMMCLVSAALEGWLTEGHWVEKFEKRMAVFLNRRSAAMVNSGSSANLLAVSALTSRKLGELRLKPGDKVVTAAAGFPTTINPILQNGLVPVFIDVELGTYVPTVEAIIEGIEKGAKAVVLAHTLGNPWPVQQLLEGFKSGEPSAWIIEDNCDALGSKLGQYRTGEWGDLVTQSFYPAHHITTGEGGMVLGKPNLMKIVRSLRDWGRDCWCQTGQDNTCGKRFEWEFPNLPKGYDHKYVYSELGYNMKSTDLQGALGYSQISKIQGFTDIRKANFTMLYSLLEPLEEYFILPEAAPRSKPSWFGFPLTIRQGAPFSLPDVERYLADKKIGTRRLFAGDYMSQPLFDNIDKNIDEEIPGIDYQVAHDLTNTARITLSTFWIGVWHGLETRQIEYMAESLISFAKSF